MNDIKLGTKYNYRDEWARFVSTLSSVREEESHELAARIIRAVGDVVSATGGALWLHESGTSFRLAAKINYTREQCSSGDAPVLAVWLVTHDDILDLSASKHVESMVDLPAWVPAPPAGWLLIPLHHRSWMVGFLILKTDQPRQLDSDDRDILRLVAHNAASYLSEDERNRQLREAKAFEKFTRQFAFVMHDLKNMSAQLALTFANARQHKDNPEFVADMIDTVGGAVQRMNSLISRLRGDAEGKMVKLEIDSVLEAIVSARDDERILCPRSWRKLIVAGNPKRLRTAIDHIVDNALQSRSKSKDAIPPTVSLNLRSVADEVRIEVTDNGDGMDERFINEQLFTPFNSNKSAGFGLGMTEAREIIEQMNGRIVIESEPGAGTTVSLCLPRVFEEPK